MKKMTKKVTIYTCDRCKNEYDGEAKNLKIRVAKVDKEQKVDGEVASIEYELCESCAEAFNRWINGYGELVYETNIVTDEEGVRRCGACGKRTVRGFDGREFDYCPGCSRRFKNPLSKPMIAPLGARASVIVSSGIPYCSACGCVIKDNTAVCYGCGALLVRRNERIVEDGKNGQNINV